MSERFFISDFHFIIILSRRGGGGNGGPTCGRMQIATAAIWTLKLLDALRKLRDFQFYGRTLVLRAVSQLVNRSKHFYIPRNLFATTKTKTNLELCMIIKTSWVADSSLMCIHFQQTIRSFETVNFRDTPTSAGSRLNWINNILAVVSQKVQQMSGVYTYY